MPYLRCVSKVVSILMLGVVSILVGSCTDSEPSTASTQEVLTERLYLGLEDASCQEALASAIASGDLSDAFHCSAFVDRVLAEFRSEYLQGLRSEDIVVELIDYEQIRLFQPKPVRSWAQHEFDRMLALHRARDSYLGGRIHLTEVQIRFLDNLFFDEINMGCTNFVTVSFQHLLGRQPTRHELIAGETMCRGDSATLLFEEGAGKRSFLEILTRSGNYREHQLRSWYEFLYYKPLAEQEAPVLLHQLETRHPDGATIDDILVLLLERSAS